MTYNWDTGTLFVVGDGGTSIVQVTLTGQLINSMTLAPGNSPQGTAFYDPEGLTYIGNGEFVMTEERDRQAVEFTYTAGTTLDRSSAQTVDLGTFVQNIGLEGVSYDPQTGGYIFVKETLPEGSSRLASILRRAPRPTAQPRRKTRSTCSTRHWSTCWTSPMFMRCRICRHLPGRPTPATC